MAGSYVIADPYLGGYYLTFTKRVPDLRLAKTWKRPSAAVEAATLVNVSRNVPAGCAPSHKYRALPNAEVHQIDESGRVVAVIPAPPKYIRL